MYLIGVFIASFVILACLRIPVPFSVGMAGIIGMLAGGISLSTIPGVMANSLDSFAFLAIPAFIYAGDVMSLGGITQALVAWVRAIAGRMKGSVGAATVVASALFGTISGSSVATVSAIGGMMLPELLKAGYRKEYAVSMIAASGFLGILIPPSIPGVVFALAAGQSIGAVWLSTAGPGILLSICYILFNRIFYAHQETVETGRFSAWEYFAKIGKTTSRGGVALLMPLIIFGGVYGGILTPTEAGAIAVLYGLIAGWVIFPVFFRDRSKEGLWLITRKSAVTSSAICLLIAFASIPNSMFVYGQSATAVTKVLFGLTESPAVFLLLVNTMLLIVGMFMETNTSILLLAPILVPTAKAYGIDPVHFGAIMLLNLEIGLITPPFAVNLFVACRLGDLSMDRVLKPIMGFIAICIPVLFLTTYVPAISMALVKLFLG